MGVVIQLLDKHNTIVCKLSCLSSCFCSQHYIEQHTMLQALLCVIVMFSKLNLATQHDASSLVFYSCCSQRRINKAQYVASPLCLGATQSYGPLVLSRGVGTNGFSQEGHESPTSCRISLQVRTCCHILQHLAHIIT